MQETGRGSRKAEKKRKGKKHRLLKAGMLLFLLSAGLSYVYLNRSVPDQVNIVQGEQEFIRFPLLFHSTLEMKDKEVSLGNPSDIPSSQIRISGNEPFQMLGMKEGSYQMEVRLFGFLKVKDVQVDVVDESYVIPCGTPVGIYLKSDGILVIGTGTLTGADGMEVEPAYGILRSGDYIEAINGKPLSKKEEIGRAHV